MATLQQHVQAAASLGDRRCPNGQSAKTLSHTNPWPVLDFIGNMETSELQRKLGFPAVKKPIRYHTACWSEFRNTFNVRVEG